MTRANRAEPGPGGTLSNQSITFLTTLSLSTLLFNHRGQRREPTAPAAPALSKAMPCTISVGARVGPYSRMAFVPLVTLVAAAMEK